MMRMKNDKDHNIPYTYDNVPASDVTSYCCK